MIKLSKFNYIIWRSQILSLIGSLVVEHHIEDAQKPNQNIEEREKKLEWENFQLNQYKRQNIEKKEKKKQVERSEKE